METAPAQHSPDGAWWWSGNEWFPAWSQDHRWWFDGTAWREARRPALPLDRFERFLALAWLVLFGLTCLWGQIAAPHITPDDGLPGAWLASGAVIVVSWLLGVTVTGYVLSRRGRSAALRAFVPLVWFLMGMWVAFLANVPSPASQPGDDVSAGAGLVLLATPALGVLWLLAALGVGLARLVARLSRVVVSR